MASTNTFTRIPRLSPGDKVAVLSPSFAAPGRWPHVYELGLERLRTVFKLAPVAFPTTAMLDASPQERASDLIAAFEAPEIKAVIATLGGDDEVVWIKHLPSEPFLKHPKAFFGYSDTTHLQNFLWLLGIPSFYGGALFTEFAMQGEMDEFTVKYLKHALFVGGSAELESSSTFSDTDLNWDNPALLLERRRYQSNEGWYWDGAEETKGITWGGCLESVDELLRHGSLIPTLSQFEGIVLILETSEELPPAADVFRFMRALGERGILERIQGLLVGRAKAWNLDRQVSDDEKVSYKKEQRDVIVDSVRRYNTKIPIVQNVDFGHTAPQICLPYGSTCSISAREERISVRF